MRHNHPVAAELAGTYPENRRLTETEKLEITDFLQSAPDNLTVKEHIERKFHVNPTRNLMHNLGKFGKPCTLNDVRQMKYRMRKMQKSQHPGDDMKFDDLHNEEAVAAAAAADFALPINAIPEWPEQPKEQRLTQFGPVSDQLAELVCSADTETYCERLGFLKELADAWRRGKQPMLTYSDAMLKSESCESPIDTEVVTSEPPFAYPRTSKSYISFNY